VILTVKVCVKCGEKYPDSIDKCPHCYGEVLVDRKSYFENRRITITVPPPFYQQLKDEASEKGMILSEYVASILRMHSQVVQKIAKKPAAPKVEKAKSTEN
jgi:ribosomal protein L40E